MLKNALWTWRQEETHHPSNCYDKAIYRIVATRLRDEVLKWMVGGGEGKKAFQQSVIKLRLKLRIR